MTAEEAIEILSDVGDINRCCAEDAEALDMAIKALEQQPCEDCISRQETISAIIDEYYPNAIAIDIVDTIANLPSVQPTIPTGKWEYVQYDYNPNIGNWHCSRCRGSHYSTDKLRWKYCPSCGARMQEVEE